VADGWCWFVLREEYCWLVADDWFVLREKYCWLVADKPSEQSVAVYQFIQSACRSGAKNLGFFLARVEGTCMHASIWRSPQAKKLPNAQVLGQPPDASRSRIVYQPPRRSASTLAHATLIGPARQPPVRVH
jgi:hypothetical protein